MPSQENQRTTGETRRFSRKWFILALAFLAVGMAGGVGICFPRFPIVGDEAALPPFSGEDASGDLGNFHGESWGYGFSLRYVRTDITLECFAGTLKK